MGKKERFGWLLFIFVGCHWSMVVGFGFMYLTPFCSSSYPI